MASLKGKTILLTSGPTFAPLDAVRSITNHSTGRLGTAIAHAILRQQANLYMLAGETSEAPDPDLFPRLHLQRFRTVPQLKDSMIQILQEQPIDTVIMAAAVLDYFPVERMRSKKSSHDDEWIIRLKRGEKLIEQIHSWASGTMIVGFKLESRISLEELTGRASDLMDRSGARVVIANRIEEIGDDRHIGYLIERKENSEKLSVSKPLPTRETIAEALTVRLMDYL